MAIATSYVSFTETDARIKDGKLVTGYLIISSAAVFAVGIVSLV